MPDLTYRANAQIIDETIVSIPTYFYNVTLADGETTSQSFEVHGDNIMGVVNDDSTFEPTSLSFEVSLDDSTWYTLDTVSVGGDPNTAYNLDPGVVHGWTFARIVADASPSADRNIKVIIKKV